MSLNLIPVFCNQKNMANYAYIINDPKENLTLIIDAAEEEPLNKKLKELSLTPSYILTTHHHFDHVEANLALKEQYNLKIVAPAKEFDKVPSADIPAEEGLPLNLGNITFDVINAPGHTNGHVLYYNKSNNWLFTGDVLFNLCIGGLFEGTPQQMFESLKKIKALPDQTKIFPGHEYTRACLPPQKINTPKFESYLKKMIEREKGYLSPSTLKEEKAFNPYMKAETLTQFLGLE